MGIRSLFQGVSESLATAESLPFVRRLSKKELIWEVIASCTEFTNLFSVFRVSAAYFLQLLIKRYYFLNHVGFTFKFSPLSLNLTHHILFPFLM